MTVPVRELLERHQALAGLEPRLLDVLANHAHVAVYPAGGWIARVDSAAGSFLAIVGGRAAIEIAPPARKPVVVATVHEGDLLGWSWLVPPHRWHFDVLALEEVRAVVMDGSALRQRFDIDHELAYQLTRRLLSVVATRLEATRVQLLDLYAHEPH
jgi:CRP-like cAMP-binding protein